MMANKEFHAYFCCEPVSRELLCLRHIQSNQWLTLRMIYRLTVEQADGKAQVWVEGWTQDGVDSEQLEPEVLICWVSASSLHWIPETKQQIPRGLAFSKKPTDNRLEAFYITAKVNKLQHFRIFKALHEVKQRIWVIMCQSSGVRWIVLITE